ncbi:UNVERIFIED_CONTAM: hypothetical protein FKN15_004567 [Acipenser sinensis]
MALALVVLFGAACMYLTRVRAMCSLSLFPPPLPAGHVTLYESNNELVSATSLHNYQRQDWDPPSLLIPKETLKPHSRLESSSKAAFIHHQETLWMRSANAWHDAGLSGLLDEIANSADEVPRCMKVGACCSLAILRWVSSLHGSLFPHLTLSSEDMVAEFSQAADWAGCSVRALAWHPHTDKFAVALLDDSVRVHNTKRVWETSMWTCERWPTLTGRCQTGCWSPDGSRLLFSVQGESVIYALSFANTPGELLGQAGDSKSSVIVADLSETTFETSSGETSVGGEIQTLVWDPRGERLAVLLKGNPEKSDSRSIIAVFKTRTSPIFELLPCGFVQGEEGADPHLIHFHPHFQKGALLTVCWCNGRISHIPFYFVSAGVPRPSLGYSPPVPYPSRGSEVSERLLFSELGS